MKCINRMKKVKNGCFFVDSMFNGSATDDDRSHTDWAAASTNIPQDLFRESATWITTKRKEARQAGNMYHVGRQPVDLTALNPKPHLAYSIVQLHHHNLNNNLPSQPLRMIITGTAGTGKSFLINALAELLREQCILTATTGIAGFSIEGITLHSALQLQVRNHKNTFLQRADLQRLQLTREGKQYITSLSMNFQCVGNEL